jgi:hypothetical protein
VQGSARSFDGAAFVANSKEPLIAVTFNYRVSKSLVASATTIDNVHRSTRSASCLIQYLSARDC